MRGKNDRAHVRLSVPGGFAASQHLILGALRRSQVLDWTPHTDQSNWRLLDRRTAPVSTAFAV
jgi:hypothetical protein